MSALDLSFERLDADGALAEAAQAAGDVSRAGFLAAGLAGSLGVLGLTAAGAGAQAPRSDDVAILNYALTLEYLQAAFYTEAERLGALKGQAAQAAGVVGAVERAHVEAFRGLLGSKAIRRPSFDFQGVTESSRAFLKTAVAFEDLAVAAYKGQASRLASDSALEAALSIHSVEARHAAWMRYLVGVTPARDAFDAPKSEREVARIVRSTHFVASTPATRSSGLPRFTG